MIRYDLRKGTVYLALAVWMACCTVVAWVPGNAWANGDAPWDADVVSAEALTKVQAEAQKKLEALGDVDAASDQGKWQHNHKARVAIINDFLRALALEGAPPTQEDLRARKKSAEHVLKDYLCGVPPDEDSAAASRKSLSEAEADTENARKQLQGTLDALAGARGNLEFLRSGLDVLPPLVERVRKRIQDPKADLSSALAKYKRENDEIFLRAAQERMRIAGKELARLTDFVDTLRTEEERDQYAVRLFQIELEFKQNKRAENLEEAGKEGVARAAEKRRTAEAEQDPLQRVIKTIDADQQSVLAKTTLDEGLAARLQRILERERRRASQLTRQSDTVERRFLNASDISAESADQVLDVVSRVRSDRDDLEQTLIPAWKRDREYVLSEKAELEHRLDDLANPFDESEIRKKFYDQIRDGGEEITRSMRRLISMGLGHSESTGLRSSLRARVNILNGAQATLKDLGELYGKRMAQSAKVLGSVTSKLYRVRSDVPFGLGVVREAFSDVARVPEVVGDSARVGAFGGALKKHTFRFLFGLLAIALLFWASQWMRRRHLARMDRGTSARRRGLWPTSRRFFELIVRSCALPLGLIALSYGVHWLELPAGITEPTSTLLRLSGIFLGIFSLGRAVFRENGFAHSEWGMSPDLSSSLLTFTKRASLAALVLYVPSVILGRVPFRMPALSRVLYTAFLFVFCYQLFHLLRRKHAFSSALTAWSPFWRRFLPFVRPVLYLLLAGIVVGELMGYRVGSALALKNVVQTIITVLLLIGLYLVVRSSIRRAAHKLRRSDPDMTDAESGEHISDSVVHQLTRLTMGVVGTAAIMLLADFWGLDDTIRGFLSEFKLYDISEEQSLTLWEVGKALAWIVGAHFLVGNLGAFLETRFVARMKKGGGSGGYVLLTFARYALLFFAYTAALLTMGFRFADVGWLLAAFSVGIGFGLQEIVANFISGIILLLERPVRIGDAISVGNTWGIVERINVRATHVTNRDNQEIIVPNKNFITQEVTNWSRRDRETRGKVPVGVAYGTDLEHVVKILTRVVRAEPRVLKDPAPKVLFSGFGDSSLDFTVLYFCDVEQHIHVKSDLGLAIDKAFREGGIEIPFPQSDLHIKGMPLPEVAPSDEESKDQRKSSAFP